MSMQRIMKKLSVDPPATARDERAGYAPEKYALHVTGQAD